MIICGWLFPQSASNRAGFHCSVLRKAPKDRIRRCKFLMSNAWYFSQNKAVSPYKRNAYQTGVTKKLQEWGRYFLRKEIRVKYV